MAYMTEMQAEGTVPPLTLEWRLKMALAHGGVSVREMADYLGVTPDTLARWTGGRSPVKRHVILAWAMRTGVAPAWLEHGTTPTAGGDGGQVYGIRDSNPEPADLEDYALTWGDAA